MTTIPEILAESDGYIQVIGLVVLLILGAVASLIQKLAEKRQQQRAEQARLRQAQRSPQAVPEASQPPAPAGEARPAARRQPAEPPRLTPAEQIARAMQEALGITVQVPAAEPSPSRSASRQISDLERARRRAVAKRREALQRRKKKKKRSASEGLHPSPGVEHTPGRLVPSVDEASRESQAPQPTGLNLRDAEQAKRAIIYHEIFSTPKALREGPEMWEL